MNKTVQVIICEEVLEDKNLKPGDTLRWINNNDTVCVITMPTPNPLDKPTYNVGKGHEDALVTGQQGKYCYHANCCKLESDPRLIVT